MFWDSGNLLRVLHVWLWTGDIACQLRKLVGTWSWTDFLTYSWIVWVRDTTDIFCVHQAMDSIFNAINQPHRNLIMIQWKCRSVHISGKSFVTTWVMGRFTQRVCIPTRLINILHWKKSPNINYLRITFYNKVNYFTLVYFLILKSIYIRNEKCVLCSSKTFVFW